MTQVFEKDLEEINWSKPKGSDSEYFKALLNASNESSPAPPISIRLESKEGSYLYTFLFWSLLVSINEFGSVKRDWVFW